MAGLFDVLRVFGLIAAKPPRRPKPVPTGPRRRKPRRGGMADPLPVEPNRPNNLTGGAAAALEFDD